MFIFSRYRKFNATKGGKARHVKFNTSEQGKARKVKFNKFRSAKFHESLECKWNKPCKYGCGYTQLDCATPGMLTNCCYGGMKII